jgi:alkaline phosphatase D
MNTRRTFINKALAASTITLITPSITLGATKKSGDKKRKAMDDNLRPLDLNAAHKGSPVIDQRILASSQPAQNVLDFFRESRLIFDANRKASFAELTELRIAALKHGVSITGGPMLGELTHNSAKLWVRTIQPARVEVIVQTPYGTRRYGPVNSNFSSDFTAVVNLTALPPSTKIPYQVIVDGKPIPIPKEAAINTPAAPNAPGKLTIAFGSCFHKTGLANNALLERMRLRGASAFISIGDCAVDDRDAQVGLHRSDYLLRDLHPGWQNLAASTAIYAAWDDHDYFNNDKAGIPKGYTAADRDALRSVWLQNWNNPACGFTKQGTGIFFHTRIGPCDLIMLDTRSMRTTPGAPNAYLGEEQSRWLEQELKQCSGAFTIITSGTMWSDNISNGKDSWGVWDRAGREHLFNLLDKLPSKVLLLSGDRHGARVIRIPRPSGDHLWEFEAASLGAHRGPPAFGEPKELQPFGVTEQTLFGECVIDTTSATPTAKVSMVDPDGKEHWSHTLS